MRTPDGREPLRGQVALVSGAGRGIGRVVALSFARAGGTLVLGARTDAEVETVAAECRAAGAEVLAVHLDVTSRLDCMAAVDATRTRFGGIDILVNNAGIATSQKFTDVTDDIWNLTMCTNLNGAFFLTQAALPLMIERGRGAVITISSIAGKHGAPYIAPYVASKHAVVGLMRALAAEYAHTGITFNCVCPAYVNTPMTEGAIIRIMEKTGRTRDLAMHALLTPQGRLVEPEEVAAVCLLLGSPQGRGINGQAINVDGGQVQS
jgi:NAD(P)-dependent dehydrogenase (short-subunit alcohol dehydrogenase family)